jgi:hypothetical protein
MLTAGVSSTGFRAAFVPGFVAALLQAWLVGQILKVMGAVVPPPPPPPQLAGHLGGAGEGGLETVTEAEPVFARSAAGIVAIMLVEVIVVVASVVMTVPAFHFTCEGVVVEASRKLEPVRVRDVSAEPACANVGQYR